MRPRTTRDTKLDARFVVRHIAGHIVGVDAIDARTSRQKIHLVFQRCARRDGVRAHSARANERAHDHGARGRA
jgi:hypothetical protein